MMTTDQPLEQTLTTLDENPEYAKARELGRLVLNSDYKKNLDEALFAYENNPEAKHKFETYTSTKADYLQRLRRKEITADTIASERAHITALGEAMDSDQDIMHLLVAEEEYNDYVNKIMQLLKATIQEGKGCGGLGGCGGGGCSTGG